MSQTSTDLFANLRTVVSNKRPSPSVRIRLLHETLVVVCAEGLKDTHYGFGDLNSQLESLIRINGIAADEADALRQARRNSNRSHFVETGGYTEADLLYDVAAVARLVSRVFRADIPADLTALLPHDLRRTGARLRQNAPDKRCVVKTFDAHTITVVIDEDGEQGERVVRYTEENQYARMEYLYDILKPGMHLNLLGCQQADGVITPRLIVVEPDCLMDISVIASCFEEYGHHPLLYLLSRMKPRANTQAILLGHYAGACLDDIINNPQFSAAKTLIRSFRERALEYATCMDFDGGKFKDDAARQSANILGIVGELRKHYDLSKAILEPSFVCEKLGLQGRVDLMTTDMRLLVEQKSGRNMFIERNSKNAHGGIAVEKHYVQVLLYFGILYYNFHVQRSDIRLLYSKYPLPDGLLNVTNLMRLFYEAIRFRNEAMALEFDMAEHGIADILPQLTEHTLNVAHCGGFFYDNYLRPPLVDFLTPLHHLSPVERAYFCRMTQFVIRENIMSRVGVVEGTGSCMANLWNMPLAEKKETGNIYTALRIVGKEKSLPDGEGGYDIIMLAVPDQGVDFLPNFRRGDMVYLYAYPDGEEPDARCAMLFKGGLAEIHTDQLVVKLADGQQNEAVFDKPVWAIEHAGSDVGGSAALRALYALVTAPKRRRDLLLGQRAPERDTSLTLSQSYNKGLDDMLLKAKQAKDFFLLVGPPGTGKTSMALQYMVREALASSTGAILLMAYTNRAVDEICGMLTDNGIDYLRVGSELSCAETFVPHLLQNRVGEKPTLTAMQQLILNARVIVGTTSMIQSRSYLFNLKTFDLAIVDEASQILEPSIIGLLASINVPQESQGYASAFKFILIGDYKQLPAVVQQGDADSAVTNPLLLNIGLGDCKNSLFERLIRQELRAGRNDFIGILHRQGRMHPEIAEFPNREFYTTEDIHPVPLPHQQATEIGYTLPSQDAVDDLLKRHRLLFFASGYCRQPEISDKVNAEEARIVVDILRRVRRFYGDRFNADKTVGVIVPYRNQIAMIRKGIEASGMRDLENISIDTVERYQGSQRDVIIYSFTIQQAYQLSFLTANTFEEEGHLIDRKLNVALTRARKQLILTGNPQTLSQSPLFSRLMAFVKDRGGYVSEGDAHIEVQ